MEPVKRLSEFRKWKINLNHYCLENEKREEIFVEPRLLKLLNFLFANANKVVKRNELVDHVWGDVVVTEESLSKAIFDLRKFLLANFKDAPHIMTIRKVGYKLELKTQTTPTQNYRILRLIVKVVVSILILALTFVIVVRAIRYEN
jgi:DNA-binding winged helix-turn-helix (wHTH) protein